MNVNLKSSIIITGLIFSLSPIAQAQDLSNTEVDISQCMSIESPPLRYACYDELAEAVRESESVSEPAAAASPAPTPAPAPATPAVVATPAAKPSIPPVEESIVVAESSEVAEIDSFGMEEELPVLSIPVLESQSLENFEGDGPKMVTRVDGKEELQDRIAELLLKGKTKNIWEVTLSGGQIWRQTYPKRFKLKEGGVVKIYPSGWGKTYRLEMVGLSGFIQVKRVN